MPPKVSNRSAVDDASSETQEVHIEPVPPKILMYVLAPSCMFNPHFRATAVFIFIVYQATMELFQLTPKVAVLISCEIRAGIAQILFRKSTYYLELTCFATAVSSIVCIQILSPYDEYYFVLGMFLTSLMLTATKLFYHIS